MAKRQLDEQRQREQKAFLIEPPSRLAPYTVPTPFKLNTPGSSEGRRERQREEIERERMAECTFKPRTNEADVGALLRAAAAGKPVAGLVAAA